MALTAQGETILRLAINKQCCLVVAKLPLAILWLEEASNLREETQLTGGQTNSCASIVSSSARFVWSLTRICMSICFDENFLESGLRIDGV